MFRARAFYEQLGWVVSDAANEDVAFFQSGCMVLGIWDREQLAADSSVADSNGWGGVTLAHNPFWRIESDGAVLLPT